ncbi:MAG: hypothetical protein K2G73_04005 [Eubacterium sp.]|nr:hypothetical protein [Eubacterium sp.]
MKEFLYADNDNYGSEFVVTGINSVTLGCYSCAQMKALYPTGFNVICQIGKGKKILGDIKCDGCSLPAYSLDYSIFYSSAGYIQLGDNGFAVIKKSNFLFLLLYFSAVISIAVLMAFCLTDYSGAFAQNLKNDSQIREEIILPYNVTTKQHIDTKNVDFEVPQQSDITFIANQRLQNYSYSNQKINPYYVVIQILFDDEDIIYESDFIPPGGGIQKIELKKTLPKGTYNATVRYFTYSFDSEINALSFYDYQTKVLFS